MGSISVIELVEFLGKWFLTAVIVLLWWVNERRRDKEAKISHELTTKALAQYGKDMEEIREMYESNVRLVERYEQVAGDLRDVVILNTQAMTRMNDDIRNNQYCPRVRINKRGKGGSE
jgi:hypothetical protein